MNPLPERFFNEGPISALAPMQDITHLPFMKVVHEYGAPDYFFTEYFRVHEYSKPEPHILDSIINNPSASPVFAQLIGESVPDLVRMAKAICKYPVAGIDLNMGCPAPKIYKKNVGGGLLRDPNQIDKILGNLRENITTCFTVKMRIGFDDTENFESILNLINKHNIDLLSLHGRTVKEGYRSAVHYDLIRQASETVQCPVLANGNITSPSHAFEVLKDTQSTGIMIGRAAIRNPWIFRQIREHHLGTPIFQPTFKDVRGYIQKLWTATYCENSTEKQHVNRIKKFLNFVGQSVDAQGIFLHKMRRTQSFQELSDVCDHFLMEQPETPFPLEPYSQVIARPNCESTPAQTTPTACCDITA